MAQPAAETLRTQASQPAINTKLNNTMAVALEGSCAASLGYRLFCPKVSILGTPMQYLLESGTKR